MGVEEKAEAVEETSLSADVIAKLPELSEALASRQAKLDELAETLTINEIEAFANEVKALGEKYNYSPVILWGDKLADQVGMFDLDAIPDTLIAYSELIESMPS